MRKTILAAAALIPLIFWTAVSLNAAGYQKSYDYKNFDRIDAGKFEEKKWGGWLNVNINFGRSSDGNAEKGKWNGALNVNIVQSETFKVEISVNDERGADLYKVTQKDNTLYITQKSTKEKYGKDLEATVTVWMPVLSSLAARGIAKVEMSGTFSGDEIDVDMSGATALNGLSADVGTASLDFSGAAKCSGMTVEAETLKLNLSGAAYVGDAKVSFGKAVMDVSGASKVNFDAEGMQAKVDASGAASLAMDGGAQSLKLQASGGSKVDLSKFKCGDAYLQASGAANVSVYVTGKLNYTTSGAAAVNYSGDPKTVNGK